jgi:hypothetical protein
MHCPYFSHTTDLSVLSIIFLFTHSAILNMPLALLSSTHLHVSVFPSLHSWFHLLVLNSSYSSPSTCVVWLPVLNSICHFLNSDILSNNLPSLCVKNFLCFLLSSYISGHIVFCMYPKFICLLFCIFHCKLGTECQSSCV